MRRVAAALTLMALLGGCAGTTPTTGSNIAEVTDSCIADGIVITDIKGRKQPDGFMKTQIKGRNKTNSYKKLEYKIVWLDREGFVIKTILSKWREVSADVGQDFYITNISPNTKADDFRLYIRADNKERECRH